MKEKIFDTGKAKLNYAEGPNTGPSITFLHGLTDNWLYFLPILPFITQRWHTYALDFRGHGKSSRSPPYRYIDHIKDTISFLEHTGNKNVLFGSSMGGMISLMVAAKRPDLIKGVIFGDSSIRPIRTLDVMRNYHSYWKGWRELAGYKGPYEKLIQLVSDMPVDIPGQNKKSYGENLDIISLMNKANFLRHLDPRVLDDWVLGGTDDTAFERVVTGFDEKLLAEIQCPVLLIQGNPKKGGIFTDDAVQYALNKIPKSYHVYIEEYDHNLGLYDWNTAKLLQSTNVFLETLR